MQRNGNTLLVDINDIWQTLKVKFTVLHTQIHGTQTIRLTGSIPELGNWNKVNPLALHPEIAHSHDELIPYSITINIKVPEDNKAYAIRYSYSLWEDNTTAEWERDPARTLEILPSEDYFGQLGQQHSHQFMNTSKVFFVNGMIDKHDGFFHRDFVVCQVGNLNVFAGPYPIKTSEIQKLRDIGVDSVINLQTHDEMHEMGINWQNQMLEYKENGITTAMHYPCSNVDSDYKDKVFNAAQYLHSLVDKQNKKVFIHCASGLIRSPTVVLTYLCIFKRVKQWKSVPKSRDFITESCSQSMPNIQLVERIVAEKRDFQDKQIDLHTEKDRKRQEIIRRHDQKARILKELQLEKEDRHRREIERQRMLAQRRKDHADEQARLDRESQHKMNQYRNQIEEMVNQRQNRIISEQNRLINLRNKIEGDHQQHKRELQQRREAFLAEFRRQKGILEHEIEEARRRRDDAQRRLNQTKEELQQQRLEHQQRVNELNGEIQRMQEALVELERQYENEKNDIIANGEAELEELRRQIEEYEQMIRDHNNKDRELNAEEIERQCDELFGNQAPIEFRPQKGNELDKRIAQIIEQENVRIPVIQIKDELYFIGAVKANCYLRSDNVIVRVGGGQYNFEEWVPFNHRIFERTIVINMINSGETMEWVLDQMIQEKKIKAVMYPLTKQTTGRVSSPEREKNQSPRRRDDGSPARFTEKSPRRAQTNRASTFKGV